MTTRRSLLAASAALLAGCGFELRRAPEVPPAANPTAIPAASGSPNVSSPKPMAKARCGTASVTPAKDCRRSQARVP